jgi:hypothetical protein
MQRCPLHPLVMGSLRYEENMRTIWKHELRVGVANVVTMPWPFTILSVQAQAGVLCLWAEVEADNPVKLSRTIEVYGTGWGIPSHPEPKRFIGTTQSGPVVWHAFERGDGFEVSP